MSKTGLRAAPDARPIGFEHVRWLAVLLPTLAIGLFEFLRHQWLGALLPGWIADGWSGNVVGAAVVAAVVYVFVRLFTAILQRLTLEAARSREEAAVVLERERIAREMHDGIAQALFYSTTRLREVRGLVESGDSERAQAELQAVEGHLKDAHRQVRTVITSLKQQAELEDFGEAIRRASDELAGHLDMLVECRVEVQTSVPASSRQHLVAIIQEALANAHKHGGARRAAVRVEATEEGVTAEVRDDGTGFDPGTVRRDGCYGITIMEERAHLIGARLRLDAAPGRGTRVTVRLPGSVS